MAGQFAAMRTLPPEQHKAATRLVAEVMASMALRSLSEPESVIAILRNAVPDAPLPEAFLSEASDFLDIRGDLTEWATAK